MIDAGPQLIAQQPQWQRQILVHELACGRTQPLCMHHAPQAMQEQEVFAQVRGVRALGNRTHDVAAVGAAGPTWADERRSRYPLRASSMALAASSRRLALAMVSLAKVQLPPAASMSSTA